MARHYAVDDGARVRVDAWSDRQWAASLIEQGQETCAPERPSEYEAVQALREVLQMQGRRSGPMLTRLVCLMSAREAFSSMIMEMVG